MSSIEFSIDKTARQPGETFTVPIKLLIDEPTKVRGVYAKYHAAEVSKATYTAVSYTHLTLPTTPYV